MTTPPGAHNPRVLRQRLRRVVRPAWLGTLRRTTPLSDRWGYDRGRPIDRYYIEQFVAANRADIRGRVLEVKDTLYTNRYGCGVIASDVVDNDARNPNATIVTDLAAATIVPDNTFDCCIVTQTLQYIYDVAAAGRELHRILRPGGVLLATVPAVTRLDPLASYPDYWRFTVDSCTRIFGAAFDDGHLQVAGHGNVLAAVAFLEGIAQEELARSELELNDPLFPVVVTVRAVKQAAA